MILDEYFAPFDKDVVRTGKYESKIPSRFTDVIILLIPFSTECLIEIFVLLIFFYNPGRKLSSWDFIIIRRYYYFHEYSFLLAMWVSIFLTL